MASVELIEGALLNARYRIRGSLGRGGMGTVYLAEHERLKTVVAVKEVRGQRANEAEYQAALEQCEQEARILVRLDHANLPKVTDAFIENDRFYLVMEYIEGVTLEQRLREQDGRPLPVAQVVEWGLQVADVLAYLHSQEPPIIFRDLKPSNVMVQANGHVRLIDFGIARRFQPGAIKDTALLGSVGYSPPEQFGRHQTDTRSDVYAFGATLHHLLTGRDPIEQPFKFPPARALNPEVPESLSRLLEDCLAIDAGARPATIHQVALRLLATRDELNAQALTGKENLSAGSGLAAGGGPDANLTPVAPSAPTGPRIISSKLAEAEAQKRRTGNPGAQETRAISAGLAGSGAVTTPVGAKSAPASILTKRFDRSWRGALLALVVSIVAATFGSGIMTLILNRNHARPKPAPRTLTTPAPPVNLTPAPLPDNAATPAPDNSQPAPLAPPDESEPGAANAPALADMVIFDRAEVSGVAPDAQGQSALWLAASGTLKGQAGKAGTVAAFFYDAAGVPLTAKTARGVFANPSGQLSVAQSVPVVGDSQPFQVALSVPLDEFTLSPDAKTVKVRFVVFADHRRVGQTDSIDAPLSLFNAPSLVPPSGSSAPPNAGRRGGQEGIGFSGVGGRNR